MNPYVIIAAGVFWLASTVGGFFYGQHVRGLADAVKELKTDAEAATLLDQLDKTAAAKDSLQAEASRNLEASHANQLQAVSATADAFRAALAERVRSSVRGQSCTGSVSPSTTVAGKPETASPGGDRGSGPVDLAAVSHLRDTVRKLQEDVKFCWAFVGSVGR